MRIEWKISKKKGHLRPQLRYRVSLEPFEVELAVPMVTVTSAIPKPPDAWQRHVWPGTHERGKMESVEVYDLSTPSHKTITREELLMLPMRPGNQYPEVEESFRTLRSAYEKALLEAYENSSFETGGRLEMTQETKERLAPTVAAQKFLALVEKSF